MKKDMIMKKNPYSDYIAASIRAAQKEKEMAEQKTLDFQKWLESEYKNMDTSGMMDQCLFCEYRNEHHECTCSPELRYSNAICSHAFREMKEKLGK